MSLAQYMSCKDVAGNAGAGKSSTVLRECESNNGANNAIFASDSLIFEMRTKQY